MPVANLTDMFLRKARSATGRTIFWDQSLPAFGVRVGTRTKMFVVMHGRGRRKITLGPFPGLPLKEARRRAAAIIFGPDNDPQNIPSTPLSAALKEFLASHRVRPRTLREYKRLIEKFLIPVHGATPIGRVTTRDILAITDKLAATPAEQIHAHGAMSVFFRWALVRHLIAVNPMASLPLPARPGSRDRVLTDDELIAVYRAAQTIGFPFGFIILICIHTGMRRTEAASLKWSYITDTTITLPPSLTKNNTKLVLPNLLKDHLRLIQRTSDYLFPSEIGATIFTNWVKGKRRMDALSGVSDWVLHDLRRTFTTIHARIDTPPHVTEAMLNHKTGSRTPLQRIYDRHDYLPQMRTALENYEAFLLRLMADKDVARTAVLSAGAPSLLDAAE